LPIFLGRLTGLLAASPELARTTARLTMGQQGWPVHHSAKLNKFEASLFNMSGTIAKQMVG
jgi:hypothetical protein